MRPYFAHAGSSAAAAAPPAAPPGAADTPGTAWHMSSSGPPARPSYPRRPAVRLGDRRRAPTACSSGLIPGTITPLQTFMAASRPRRPESAIWRPNAKTGKPPMYPKRPAAHRRHLVPQRRRPARSRSSTPPPATSTAPSPTPGIPDLDRALRRHPPRGFALWRKVSAFDRSKVMRRAADPPAPSRAGGHRQAHDPRTRQAPSPKPRMEATAGARRPSTGSPRKPRRTYGRHHPRPRRGA